ncbi:sulfotransferase [Fluviibacterium sp. DFM31]|uniref:Sulfotransferase n=1 Tax=Meridianimarinicoccus marinus TaxID=3231483 RepID=A0ABV3L7Y8_9RHOB
MARMPDFLIIGAARAGTTALYEYLRQAPDVFMPDGKEPNFFCYEGLKLDCQGPGADFINNSITDLARYQALFDPAPEGAILGEASPLYLYEPRSAERIHHHVPGARLVVILRNPIEQAFSHFMRAQKLRIEPLTDFTEALKAEDDRRAKGWQPMFGYSSFPRYGEQLARFLALFPRDQILVRRYEDFDADPVAMVAEVQTFIGADTAHRPDVGKRHNAGGVPRNAAFQDFLMKPNPITGTLGAVLPRRLRWQVRDWIAGFNLRDQRPAITPEARAILVSRLQDDVAQLGELLGEDFSGWLRG